MNPTDEARLDWAEAGPDEDDVLADNEVLSSENARLNAEVARLDGEARHLRRIEAAATDLLTYWHEAPASTRDYVEEANERVRDLIDHLAAVVGGLS